jgi:hypothetical protein
MGEQRICTANSRPALKPAVSFVGLAKTLYTAGTLCEILAENVF